MTINYVPNDPLARWPIPIMRSQQARPEPASNLAGFWYNGFEPEAKYGYGTKGFLFWQCSESALAALEMWAALDGGLKRWVQGRQRLDLRQNDGQDLNAYYDRSSLAFFEDTIGTKTTYSGASQDVVAHEVGHGLLDAIRPDLWFSNYLEANAFHEAFGDCVAILTALHDRKTRVELLNRTSNLWKKNFVEATAEDLAGGIKRWNPTHNAAKPRHAFNWYEWDFPSNLPFDGGPGVLLNEIHSFGQIFSGCFWDTIGNIFNLSASQTQQSLRRAAQIAGRLLIAGTRTVTETPRFTHAMGEAMLEADEDQNGGANEEAIRAAFEFHNLTLGTTSVMPVAAVSGPAPLAGATKASISPTTSRDLARQLGAAPGSRMVVRPKMVAGRRIAVAVHERLVPLDMVDKRLRGVTATGSEAVLIGRHAKGAAIMGALPQTEVTHDEVCCFVRSLLHNNCIDLGGKKRARRRAVSDGGRAQSLPTHRVRTIRGKKVLERVRMACPIGGLR